MAEKITINLLPVEFIAEEIKKNKFVKIQKIGIGIVLLMIFLSFLTLSLRIFQSNNTKSAQITVANAESKVTAFSSKQAQLLLLKDRLVAINQYLGISSKQVDLYNLSASLIPPDVIVNTASVGSEGSVVISAVTTDPISIDRMISDFLNKEKNEGKINQVSLENISRGRDGTYRVSFTVQGVNKL